ncbi:6-phosphogluconate dehydrogenase [Pleurostoma richardsiae]|uniref:6-phosphogluconate dehydrogenase n=1 Tax=Pleurostoma richardsiae TaxID=41990 RepID=A0AA38VPT5_9PEZI|nr:6-phosphogluconate dehydrogenase [Pleurostoma richardsiae]
MAPKVFFIGLGNIGKGMCKNIVAKAQLGGPLMLYNRTTQRAQELSAQLGDGKTEVVTSIPDGVAKADVVFLSLTNDQVVLSTLDTILQGDVKGKLIVDTSTIHPDSSEKAGKKVVAAGAEFVAAPIFGAPPMAESGSLVGVLAGPKSSVGRAKPFFKGVTSRAEIDMSGEPWGKSTLLKITGNTFILNMVEQIAEGHVFAEKSGLGTNYLHQFIESLFPGVYSAYSTRMLTGDYWKRDPPLFGVDLARKDGGHALKLAEAAGVKLRNVEAAETHLAQVKEHAGEKGDIAGIYGAIRKESGLKFENDV